MVLHCMHEAKQLRDFEIFKISSEKYLGGPQLFRIMSMALGITVGINESRRDYNNNNNNNKTLQCTRLK